MQMTKKIKYCLSRWAGLAWLLTRGSGSKGLHLEQNNENKID